jgi:hypothetical protein
MTSRPPVLAHHQLKVVVFTFLTGLDFKNQKKNNLLQHTKI